MPSLSANNVYIGVDPGSSGGLAAIAAGELHTLSMPENLTDLWDWLFQWSRPYGWAATCVLEKVGGYQKPRVGSAQARADNPQPGHMMFKFGAGFGHLQAFLVAANIKTEELAPNSWQAKYQMKPEGAPKTEWKNRLKAKAQQLFPGEHITLNTADAVILADLCRLLTKRGLIKPNV